MARQAGTDRLGEDVVTQDLPDAATRAVPDNDEAVPSASCASPGPRTVTCEQCGLFGFLRLLEQMQGVRPDILETVLLRQQPIPRGERLFRQGQPFQSVFAVKSGCFKSYIQPVGADEQVVGFHLPGELLGLESHLSDSYGCSVQALENSTVCHLSLRDLEVPEALFSAFQEQVIQALTSQVAQERRQSMLAGRRSSEERLAAFLINLSERYAERGFEGHAFRLAMLRPDIASYLGLAMETVSRTLGQFRDQGLLEISGKHLRILDYPCMRSIAQHCAIT